MQRAAPARRRPAASPPASTLATTCAPENAEPSFFYAQLKASRRTKVGRLPGSSARKPLLAPAAGCTGAGTSTRLLALVLICAGATAGASALVLAGCGKDDSSPGTIDVGAGDAGILNYAYALERLEAAFYAQVKTGTYYTSASAAEKRIFDDLAGHEAIYRAFLMAAISANGFTPLQNLTPDFSSITFSDRASVLQAAQTFEDTYGQTASLLAEEHCAPVCGVYHHASCVAALGQGLA